MIYNDLGVFSSMIHFFIAFGAFFFTFGFVASDMPFFYLNFYNIGIFGNLFWFSLTWTRIYTYDDFIGSLKNIL